MADNHATLTATVAQHNHYWMRMTNMFAQKKITVWTPDVSPRNEEANEGWEATIRIGEQEYKHGTAPTRTKAEAKEAVAKKVLLAF
ncbi:hypothetical protein FRB90_006517, partial [Tulasnella sp. 427]